MVVVPIVFSFSTNQFLKVKNQFFDYSYDKSGHFYPNKIQKNDQYIIFILDTKMILHRMQEIIRLVDKHRDVLPDQDYIEICNHLEEIYNDYYDSDKDDNDWDYGDSELHKKVKLILNIVTINIAINLLVFVIYSKIMS
jgi:hypothetical protein